MGFKSTTFWSRVQYTNHLTMVAYGNCQIWRSLTCWPWHSLKANLSYEYKKYDLPIIKDDKSYEPEVERTKISYFGKFKQRGGELLQKEIDKNIMQIIRNNLRRCGMKTDIIVTWIMADDWPPEDDAPGRNIPSSLSEVSPPLLDDRYYSYLNDCRWLTTRGWRSRP